MPVLEAIVAPVVRPRVRLPASLRTGLLILLAVTLFYWKITLTNQFSLLTDPEAVNQQYTWLQFWTQSIRHWSAPLWDPYVWGGRSFAGEMQTAAFYPPHLLLAAVPAGRDGLWPAGLYHLYFVFVHFLGACFLFALAREFGLGRLAAFVAGICFSLGGFVSRMGWPHMLESAIWLPPMFLFLLRAIRAETARRSVREAACGGLTLGLSILAGGLHVVILEALAVVSAGIYYACVRPPCRKRAWATIGIIVGVGLCAGAVQLLPSMEYSRQALRFIGTGPWPANEKIPYDYLTDGLWPQGVVVMAIPQAFGGRVGNGEICNPYMGVFPLFLAMLGIWRNWEHVWIRYLSGLALAALLYSFGGFSPLHGWLYALIPRLWMAREAARAVFPMDFALAILAGFGVEFLFSRGFTAEVSTRVDRIYSRVALVCAAALAAPALFERMELGPWVALSLVLILLSYGLFRMIARAEGGSAVRVVMIGLILFDLSAFDWLMRNRSEVARTSVDYLERLRSLRGAAEFLKKQPGPFRVEVATAPTINVGDAYGIETTTGGGVTLALPFTKVPTDLMNVRYRIAPASVTAPGAVYQDAAWKIYANAGGYPRAWMVHEAAPEGDGRVYDARRTASVDAAPALEARVEGGAEEVQFGMWSGQRIEMRVRARSRGLLVVSEMFYPGWAATVNGSAARIYRADGGLRGVVVPGGESVVVMRYVPGSVYLGGGVSLGAFLGVGMLVWRVRDRSLRVAASSR